MCTGVHRILKREQDLLEHESEGVVSCLIKPSEQAHVISESLLQSSIIFIIYVIERILLFCSLFIYVKIGSPYVAQSGLKPAFLSQPPERWRYKHTHHISL